MTGKTRSQIVADDIAALLRSRHPLLWIVTPEEARVETYLFEAAASVRMMARTWDTAKGLQTFTGQPVAPAMEGQVDPGGALAWIESRASRDARSTDAGLWIMRDLPLWLEGLVGAVPTRQLRNLCRSLPVAPPDRGQAIAVITPSAKVPDELAALATVIDWPLPDRMEIGAALDAIVATLPEAMRAMAAPGAARDEAIDAAIGLTENEAMNCFSKSLVQNKGRIVPKTVAAEKKRVIAKEGLLEWFDPIPGGLDAIGGLGALKDWLEKRRLAYSPEARAYGLPAPKGIFVVGPPGTGKSLTAKAVPVAFGGIPLLKLDMGALKSKFVGDSEANVRKALKVVEAIGRCVLWIDEIEKSLAGASQGAADGGVSADALSVLLGWMQERKNEAFIVATANDAAKLPPELLRKGRFDENFWCDLPNERERDEVLVASLRVNGRGDVQIDTRQIARATDGFSGAEISALVPAAMFRAFADGKREITTDDLLLEAAATCPQSRSNEAGLKALREWAVKSGVRPASSADDVGAPTSTARVLDIG